LGGVINWSLAHHLAEGRDVIDQLMDPALRAAMPPDQLARLTGAIAESLTTVYGVVVIFALLALGLAFLVPAGERTPQQER